MAKSKGGFGNTSGGFMSNAGGSVEDADIPDPYTPPDGTFNVTGAFAASGDVSGATVTTDAVASSAAGITVYSGLGTANANTDVTVGSASARTAGNLFAVSENSTELFTVDNAGNVGITGGAKAGVTPTSTLSVTPGAHLTITASTEAVCVDFPTYSWQWAEGALATQRFNKIAAPTMTFDVASTCTTASTLYLSGAPIAGTNATIINSYALEIASGDVLVSQDVAGHKFITGRLKIDEVGTSDWATLSHVDKGTDDTDWGIALIPGGNVRINKPDAGYISFSNDTTSQGQVFAQWNLNEDLEMNGGGTLGTSGQEAGNVYSDAFTLTIKQTFTQTYSTASTTVANPTAVAPTTAAVTAAGGSGMTTTQEGEVDTMFADMDTQVTALVADNLNLRQVVTGIIDELQSIGLFG